MTKKQNSWIVLASLVAVALSAEACARRPQKAPDAATAAKKDGTTPGDKKVEQKAGDTVTKLSDEECKKLNDAATPIIDEKRKLSDETQKADQDKVVQLADQLKAALVSDPDFTSHMKGYSDFFEARKAKGTSSAKANRNDAKADYEKLSAALLAEAQKTVPTVFANADKCQASASKDLPSHFGVSCSLLKDVPKTSDAVTPPAPANDDPAPPADTNATTGTLSAGTTAKAAFDVVDDKNAVAANTVAQTPSQSTNQWLEIYYKADAGGGLFVRIVERTNSSIDLNKKTLGVFKYYVATRRFDTSTNDVEDGSRGMALFRFDADNKGGKGPRNFSLASAKDGKGDETQKLLDTVIPECSKDAVPGKLADDAKKKGNSKDTKDATDGKTPAAGSTTPATTTPAATAQVKV